MHADADLLGDEGRKALDACVKVNIYGKPDDTTRYDRKTAVELLNQCYAGRRDLCYPGPRHTLKISCYGQWFRLDNLLLPQEFGEDGKPNKQKTYDIVEIHEALVNFDKVPHVEKYPKPGLRYDELKELIDKRRGDIDRECQEAVDNPDDKRQYSWLVAQRRVRDCFAGNFAGDQAVLEDKIERYNILDIHDAFVFRAENQPVPKDAPDELKKLIEENRFGVRKEYEESKSSIRRYSPAEVEQRVRGCSGNTLNRFNIKYTVNGITICDKIVQDFKQTYDIFDIETILNIFLWTRFDSVEDLQRFQCIAELSRLEQESMVKCRKAVKMECETTKRRLLGYTRNEAERRVRDCFAYISKWDTDIFLIKEKNIEVRIIDQTSYDIFEIKNAVNYFDEKKFLDRYLDENNFQAKKVNEAVDEQRAEIERVYAEVTKKTAIGHGSGFIIQGHFVVTNKHVIEDAVFDKTKEIYICNAIIDELSCEIAHYDAVKDLAVLYCQELNALQRGICPLAVSNRNKSLLPGMQVLSFGYPMSHTGEEALFVSGNVSGFKKTFSGHTMVVLNCSLNCGNSGGPVLRWILGQLRVVGVATQKHIKEILTLKEREEIEGIRESLQTISGDSLWCDEKERKQIKLNLLTIKLYDALETHTQFNLSNALPGCYVVELIKECISKYNGEGREELTEVVKWSEDHVNSLVSTETRKRAKLC